jgi:hypothetical protein
MIRRPIIGLILAIIALALLGDDDQISSDAHYCAMVAEWNATNGDLGWPPYRQGVINCD